MSEQPTTFEGLFRSYPAFRSLVRPASLACVTCSPFPLHCRPELLRPDRMPEFVFASSRDVAALHDDPGLRRPVTPILA